MVLSVSLALEESANERIPLKHVLGWGGRRKSGGDLTLNSLIRTWLSLKQILRHLEPSSSSSV